MAEIINRYRNWKIAEIDKETACRLSQDLGISRRLASILASRGIDDVERARLFLQNHWEGVYPQIAGLDQAAALLKEARLQGIPVVIYGDYDVDGICSTAIMYECLLSLGFEVSWFLPSRFVEGYGLSREAVARLAEAGNRLLLTVDCGIAAKDEVALAREMGMKVIITDHHQPPNDLPPADVIIDPRLDPEGPGQELCGAGVAFCLAMKLCSDAEKGRRWLDLLALATVADIVPLTGFNRVFVKEGLTLIGKKRPGLRALIDVARIQDIELDSYHIAFMLAPRLNAAGRLLTPHPAFELLITSDEEKSRELAVYLDALNAQRQRMEEQVYREALDLITALPEKEEILVLGSREWHQGILGIVASRISQHFCRPSILVSWENGMGKGSARGVPGFDIMKALNQVASSLEQFGGHRGAAGIELKEENFAAFCQQINQVATDCYYDKEASMTLNIDLEVGIEELTPDLGREFELLRPYGEGNPAPVLSTVVSFERLWRIGKNGEHFKGRLKENQEAEVVCFRQGALAEELNVNVRYEVAFTPEVNEYNGKTTLTMKLIDIRPAFSNHVGIDKEISDSRFLCPPASRGPQIIVCPDRRSLEKMLPYYREVYGERLVVLTGGRPNFMVGGKMLNGGEPRIFLTTPVYIPYHIKKFGRLKSENVWLLAGKQTFAASFVDFLFQEGLNVRDLALHEAGEREGYEELQVLYINRRDEWEAFADDFACFKEVSCPDRAQKLELRQLWKKEKGALLTEGDVLGLGPIAVKTQAFLSPPVSQGEALLFMTQFPAAETKWAFGKEAIAKLEHYFHDIYPDIDLVRGLLTFLASRPGRHLKFPRRRLNETVSDALGRPVTWRQVAGGLLVLTEAGVIRTVFGEEMEIVFLSGGGEVRLTESFTYVEGKQEKREFQKWRERLLGLVSEEGGEMYGT